MISSLDDILIDISMNILDIMKHGGLQTEEIDFEEFLNSEVGTMVKPTVNISINSGVLSNVTQNSIKKCVPDIKLSLIVQDLSSEKGRRFEIYNLISKIIQILDKNDLNLDLQNPIDCKGFTNTTTDRYAEAGYIVFQIAMTCSFLYVSEIKDYEDIGEMKTIVNNYYLQDPSDDGVADESGQVDLDIVDGGTPFSEYPIEQIDGGYAGTEEYEEIINGGVPGSNY